MFNVLYDSSVCYYRIFDIRFNINQKLKVLLCNGSSTPSFHAHSVVSLIQWNEVAVSYDGETHSLQMYVDGEVHFRTDVMLAQGVTPGPHQGVIPGPVLMGSRCYYSVPNSPDTSYFHGKMACMRLWNIARDLNTMRMDTPLCTIN